MEREDYRLLPLASVGVAKGFYECYVKDLQPSTKAWIVLASGVVTYDLFAPSGQTLSEGVDRFLDHSPVAKAITLGAIAVTAGHLSNLIPEKYDPIHRLVNGG
jgi:hypothetical protein